MSSLFFMSVKILILTFVIYSTNGFNFSPKPNVIFKEPALPTFKTKDKSSYFGFAIVLRNSSVIIGAPRAQSTLKSQQEINETGAIYKCHLNGTCAPFVFDRDGNYDKQSDNVYDSQKKHNQWLGASMDGGSSDTDVLIVCAPRVMSYVDDEEVYGMYGICYRTSNTLSDSPQDVRTCSPLTTIGAEVKINETTGAKSFYHQLGEQGWSVHVTDNNKEFLIGAPGIDTWKGSMIRYYQKTNDVQVIMSRRDVSRRRIMRQRSLKYGFNVPDPSKWKQANDSYFGYSVTSGYFNSSQLNQILYLASAPHANEQSGEAYIFDIFEKNIKKYYTFHESQFGEYFGYAVLGEDLNGDNLTDVIITAPQYSSTGYYEQGALYVYINKGKFVFELQERVVSPITGPGRFGTSISKIGDINRDGFNDIAVGAPFAGDGAVFIYLGSSEGLRGSPTQKLTSISGQTSWGPHMFGHGLSKGYDLYNNEFNDIAIGAPNSEAVYLYRAYPVVKIHATINSLSQEINADQNKFQINICYRITTASTRIKNQDLSLKVSADSQFKRVTLPETSTGEFVFNATATTEYQCRLLDAKVRFSEAHIFEPIQLQMHYELINDVPNSEVFCDECAAVDPSEPKMSAESVFFSTGCKANPCFADLSIESLGLPPTYIVGSNKTIYVTYQVSNFGEPAYSPQINITSSNKMPFAKIPSSCDQYDHVLQCKLNRGQPMANGSKVRATIIYDASQIEGNLLTLGAVVFSAGAEINQSSNVIEDLVVLREYTEIEAAGKPLTPHINLREVFNTTEIINFYEIKSDGPSRIRELEIVFKIPIAYKGLDVTAPIIDMNNITIQGVYDQKILVVNRKEISSSKEVTMSNEIVKNSSFSFAWNSEHFSERMQRKRRDVSRQHKHFFVHESSKKPYDHVREELIATMPINRTIVFDCSDPKRVTCTRAVLKVFNFMPKKSVTITLKYNVDLKEVNEVLIEPWKYFVIMANVDIIKVGDENGNSINITRRIEYNILSNHQVRITPIWPIIWSVLGGLLVLGATIYAMHKAGFFRRKTKEKMDRILQARRQTVSECARNND